MEIADFLQAARRRLWILILPPLLAAVAAIALVATGPAEYRTSATVPGSILVSAPNTPYTGPNAASAFVSDFIAAVKSPAVVDAVAGKTKVSADRIREGLSAVQVGEGAVVQVAYRTSRRSEAAAVATAAATTTTESFIRAPVELARYPMEQAQKEVDAAVAALAAFTAETGLVVPDRDYQIRAQQVSTLEAQAVSAAARGEVDVAARLSAAIKAEKTALNAIGPKVALFTQLTTSRDRAQVRLDSARQTFQAAEALQKVADPAAIVSLGPVREISRVEQGLRQGVMAAGGALFLALGIVVLLESMDRRGLAMVRPESRPDASAAA